MIICTGSVCFVCHTWGDGAVVEFSHFLSDLIFPQLCSRLFDTLRFRSSELRPYKWSSTRWWYVRLIPPSLRVLLTHRSPELTYKYGNLSEGVCKPGYAAAKMTAIYPKWERFALLCMFGCRPSPLNLTLHTHDRELQNQIIGIACCLKVAWGMMSLLHPARPWGFGVRNRGPHIPVQSARVLVLCLSSYPASQNQTVSLWSPCKTKNLCRWRTRPSISLLSHPPALEAFSVNGHPLPVLTHHKPASTQPTQSFRAPPGSLALCFYLPSVLARSVEHCTITILGAKLTEEQFSRLLYKIQWQHLIQICASVFFPRETRNPEVE